MRYKSCCIPEVGDNVLYLLTAGNADTINQRRLTAHHAGNDAHEGDKCAAVIVRCWGNAPGSMVNLQVFLDGNDTLWVTAAEGEVPGRFFYHEEVQL